MAKAVAFALLFLALSIAACDRPPGALSARVYLEQWPTSRELYRALRQEGTLTLVYGTGDSSCTTSYRHLAERLSESEDRLRVEVRSDTSLSHAELQDRILMLIGTPAANAVIRRLKGQLPVHSDGKKIVVDRFEFTDPESVVALSFYPSPFNRRKPLLLVSGLSDRAVLRHLEQRFETRRSFWRWGSFGFAVYRNERRQLLGAFNDSTWKVDPKLLFDFTQPEKPVLQTAHFNFLSTQANLDTNAVRHLSRQISDAADRITAFTGRTLSGRPFPYHLYPSAEEKGLILNNTDQSQVDFRQGEIHAVLNDIYPGTFNGRANQLLLRSLMDEPTTQALEEGLGVLFTKNWQKRGYAFWAKRLQEAGLLLPLPDLLSNESFARQSVLLRECLSASFVAFLIDRWGRDQFLARYREWVPAPEEIADLEKAWRHFVKALKVKPPSASPIAATPLPYLRGFNFTHEGYQIYNGYASRMARTSLARLKDMHVNAVSIVPYSWMEDPAHPSFIPVADGAGSENDESVIHAIHAAREKEIRSMLKPQIWLGHGSWPGDVEMTDEQDWQQFFDFYGRWIAHYAMLAEIHEVEILCIGTEFRHATMQREADWRQLIGSIRHLYNGRLTYAANWGEEFENIRFWDALDLMGLNCYYPLSDSPKAKEKELRQGLKQISRRIKAVADRTGKPLIITEVGFSSVKAPWVDPHLDNYDQPYNEQHQSLCYQLILDQIGDNDFCRGIFWWKWPSYLQYRGHDGGKGFAPNGKAAAETVAKYFRRMGGD